VKLKVGCTSSVWGKQNQKNNLSKSKWIFYYTQRTIVKRICGKHSVLSEDLYALSELIKLKIYFVPNNKSKFLM
jgi:hypothetical protein